MQGSVRKKGGRWYYSFELAKVGGKRGRVERAGGSTKKEALAAMRQAIVNYENTGGIINESELSVADYLEYWYKNYVQVSLRYNTQLSYRARVDSLKAALGSTHLKKLSPAAVQDYINQRHLAGRARGTIKVELAVLTKALNMAVYPYQFIRENPAHYATVPRAAKKASPENLKLVSTENYKRLLELFPRGSSYHVPLLIGYHTGLRVSEISGLTWDCVDLKARTISVRKICVFHAGEGHSLDEPKTPSSVRTIAISSCLVQALKNHQLDQGKNRMKYGPCYIASDFVCTAESGKPSDTGALKGIAAVVKNRLGFVFSFHQLRHTHASLLLASGVSMKAIQLRLGHANIITTMDVYAHLTPDLEKATAEQLEKLAAL